MRCRNAPARHAESVNPEPEAIMTTITTHNYLLAATAAVLLLGSVSLGACGDTKGDRAMSGGAIGAGAGAVGGLLVGSPVAGAVIGGAAGAAAGALTDKDQIDQIGRATV